MPQFYILMRIAILILLAAIFSDLALAQSQLQKLASEIIQDEESDTDKLKKIYKWVTDHIVYDHDISITEDNKAYTDKQRPLEVVQSGKAVCQGYANLTQALLDETGIMSYVVNGYSRNDSEEKLEAHAWNAVCLDNSWYLMDPTWDAGYLKNGTYVKRSSKDFFLIAPKIFAKTHWPNDPIWQLLHNPITKENFIRQHNLTPIDSTQQYYLDTLISYIQMDKLERQFNSARRIIRFDNKNYSGYYDLAMAYFNMANNIGESYHNATSDLHYVQDWMVVSPKLLNILNDQKLILERSNSYFDLLNKESSEYKNIANQNMRIISSVYKQIAYERNMINQMNND